MNKNDGIERIHEASVVSPDSWNRKASGLIQVLTFLRPEIDKQWARQRKADHSFLSVYMMLSAFVLENLFKAVIVAEQSDTVRKAFKMTRKLPKVLKTHALVELSVQAKVEFISQDGKLLLRQLTRHAEWQGRYPGPVRPEDLPAVTDFPMGDSFVPLQMFRDTDAQNIDLMITALKKKLTALRKEAQQGPAR